MILRSLFVLILAVLSFNGCANPAWARNTHGLPSTAEEAQALQGDWGRAYVRDGCEHSTAGGTSATITSCAAVVTDIGPPKRSIYVEEGSRSINYTAGDGVYWLIIHGEIRSAIGGWTRVANTHYAWKLSATYPTIPNKSLLIFRSVVTAGAIASVSTGIPPRGPTDFTREVFPVQYGMICDGVTDNTASLVAAYNALPSSGGRMVIPASQFTCDFGTTFTVTKPLWFVGQGAERLEGSGAGTILRYTGAGIAINFSEGGVTSSILEGFELEHSGTGTIGINVSGAVTSPVNIQIKRVSMYMPTVKFSVAAINIGIASTLVTTRAVTIAESVLRDAAPVGIRIQETIAISLFDNTIRDHSSCNVQVGATAGPAHDINIMYNRLDTSVNPAYTSAHAICAMNTEGMYVLFNHFEMGNGADTIVFTGPADTQCENCIIANNFINILNSQPSPTNVFAFDAPGTDPKAYVVIRENRIMDGRTAPPATDLIRVGNTSGDGGMSSLIVENNQIDSTITSIVDNEGNIKHRYIDRDNWDLGVIRSGTARVICTNGVVVGNVGAGEDNLMAACILRKNRMYATGIGWRATFAGTTGANANNKRVRAYYNATVIFDTGTIAANAIPWKIECNATRVGGAALRVWCEGNLLTATSTSLQTTAIATPVFGTDAEIKVTGEAVATDDIAHRYQMIELMQK